MTSVLHAAVALSAIGCTCATETDHASPAPGPAAEVVIEAGSASGPLPVTMVLDPSGDLCALAVRSHAGSRHVLCDRTAEDLSAAALRRGLGRLKSQRPEAVVAKEAWLLVAPDRAAVGRALAMRDPTFFSRVAVWVGDSPPTASLFGPTFLGSVGGRGFRALVLLGPGAQQARGWSELASRQKVRLTVEEAAARGSDPSVWPTLEGALSAP